MGEVGQRGVFPTDAGVVAAQHVQPTVRPAPDGVGRVFAAGLEGIDQLGRTQASVAAGVTVTAQAAIAHAKERIALPKQSHGPVLRRRGEIQRPVGPAVAVVIDEQANVAAPGDDDATVRIERQAVDVVGQRAVGELRDLEPLRHAQAVRRHLRRRGRAKADEHSEGAEKRAAHDGDTVENVRVGLKGLCIVEGVAVNHLSRKRTQRDGNLHPRPPRSQAELGNEEQRGQWLWYFSLAQPFRAGESRETTGGSGL